MISDGPPPYIVKVSRGIPADTTVVKTDPLQGATISLFDDKGNSEKLMEVDPGIYYSGGVIHGQQGHSYFISVTTPEGEVFESARDTIRPVGVVQDIRLEYEKRTVHKFYGDSAADVFNVYVDADAAGNNNFVRWRFTGTYQIATHPELHQTWLQGFSYFKTPLPCSGYEVAPQAGGGKLVQVSECSCCTCWVVESELEPQVSDQHLVTDGQFRNLKVGEVPINGETFSFKYHVGIEEMSLSSTAYAFFKAIRDQKEGAGNLFQPTFGKIPGNFHAMDGSSDVVGIFWAAGVTTKERYIQRDELPYTPPPPETFTNACTLFSPNATTQQPAFWQ